MEKTISKAKCRKILLILFMVVFVSRTLVNVFFIHHPWAMGDEIGTLATPAFFSGYDWRSVLIAPEGYGSGTNYYGAGFSIFLTPLFLLIKNNPYFLYQCILAVCSILQSMSVVLSFKIMFEKMKINNYFYCIFFAIASSFFVASRSTNAVNESMLIFCVWTLVYSILDLTSIISNKKRVFYSIFIPLILCYLQTVHSRTIVLIPVVLLCIFYIYLFYSKKSINFPVLIISFILFYYLANAFNAFIIDAVFSNPLETEMNNTVSDAAISILDQFKMIFLGGNIREFLDLFLSNLLALNFLTGSLFIVSVCIFAKRIITTINYKRLGLGNDLVFIRATLIGLFIFLSVIGTLVLFSFNWLEESIIASQKLSATRGYFYLRYIGAFYSPVMCLIAYDIYKKSTILNYLKIHLGSLLFDAILSFYVYKSILDRVLAPNEQLDFFHFFSPFNLQKSDSFVTGNQIVISFLILFLLSTIFFLLINFNKRKIFSFLFCGFISYQYFYISIYFDGPTGDKIYSKICPLVDTLKEDKQECIKELYFPLISGGWETPYLAQYHLPNITINKSFPKNQEAIIVVYRELNSDDFKLNDLDFNEFSCVKLSNETYLYVRGDSYLTFIEKFR